MLVEKAPEMVYESSQPQYTDGEISSRENSSSFKTQKVRHDDKALVVVPSPDSKGIGYLLSSLCDKQKVYAIYE